MVCFSCQPNCDYYAHESPVLAPAWLVLLPNELRIIAKGRRMYNAHLKAWMDDVSGNVSKQYNKHLNMYFVHANIPHKQLSQEYFVKFSAASPHATTAEQFNGLAEDIRHVKCVPLLTLCLMRTSEAIMSGTMLMIASAQRRCSFGLSRTISLPITLSSQPLARTSA
jgi:hypothetical protein